MIKNDKNRLKFWHLVSAKIKLSTDIYSNNMRNIFNHIIISTDDRLDKLKRSYN